MKVKSISSSFIQQRDSRALPRALLHDLLRSDATNEEDRVRLKVALVEIGG